MTHEEIVNFWGRENLKSWSESSLRDVIISQSSKQFLLEVGLPHQDDWTLRFISETSQIPRVPSRSNCRIIGFDGPVPICLDERHHGSAVAVEMGIGRTERFINTSVERFAEFLVLYQEYRTAARTLSEDETLKFIPSIEERMHKVDPKAFDDRNNYWPVIIEQTNQGLL
jgi:hypothetical protein